MGLLKAERSKSNYRIYTEEALYDLKLIEEFKKTHLPLEEIKRKLELKKAKDIQKSEFEKQVYEVTKQIKQLNTEISAILPLIEKLDDQQKARLSKKLTLEGSALLESLLILTS